MSSELPLCFRFPSLLPAPKLEGVPDVFRPAVALRAKLESEWIALWSHRCQAWLNWPSQLAGCKTPTDCMCLQMDFVVTMQRDYTQFLDCIVRDMRVDRDAPEEEGTQPAAGRDATPDEQREAV